MHKVSLRLWFHRLAPFFLCLLLILCHLVPYHFLPYYGYSIQWTFIPIFYFAIYNPKCLSAWAVFVLGCISELLIQSPLGVTIFEFVLVFFVANFLRKYLIELTFIPLWIVFSALLLVVELSSYALTSVLAQYPVAFQPIFVEFWVLALIYPFLMRFCAHLDRKVREAAL